MLSSMLARSSMQPFFALYLLGMELGGGACARPIGKEATMSTSTVQHLNPTTLLRNPAFSQAVEVRGPHRVVYVGGQDAVDAAGRIVGNGDIQAQAERVFGNLELALAGAGATLQNVVKWNVYIVAGQPVQPVLEVFQRIWNRRPNPPAISMMYVAALARSEFLLEIDAIAVVPEQGN
jgi:enamine deaminase RidA (YjgF/YER057c/UK114 family)